MMLESLSSERGMDLPKLVAQAQQELLQHGLTDWTFRFANTKRRLGACHFHRKRIEIARYYAANSADEHVIDTLRHEIAHALAGPKAAHGPAWKAIAIKLGAKPKACDTSKEAIVEQGDWQATCPACEQKFHRYKRPKSLTGYRCRCAAASPITFEFKGDPARLKPVQRPIAAAAKWLATCPGCQFVHSRIKAPKAGVWKCRCPHRSVISWKFAP
ncbi:hypothetical protein BH11PLA2_BH11PLA2_21720 [soil metagenome]